MNERDYIAATNLQKMKTVCSLLRDTMPGYGIDDGALSELIVKAEAARDAMFELAKVTD